MHLNGLAWDAPRGIEADVVSCVTGLLSMQAVLACVFAQGRGHAVTSADTSSVQAALTFVAHYIAMAHGDPDDRLPCADGSGPPFVTCDGDAFEMHVMDAPVWRRFWREIGADERAIRVSWPAFQNSFYTATAGMHPALHRTAGLIPMDAALRAAQRSGATVVPIRPLRMLCDQLGLTFGRPLPAPWSVDRLAGTPVADGRPPTGGAPLSGVRVIDVTRGLQGCLAARLLSMLGAQVLRIEPHSGDIFRWVPPVADGAGAGWQALNLGKEVIEMDVADAGSHDAFFDLVRDADVFLHNWSRGRAERLGLTAERLNAVAPGLVYVHAGGFPDRDSLPRVATDYVVQAYAGTGELIQPAGAAAVPTRMTFLDVLGALLCAEGALVGLIARQQVGRGHAVRTSLTSAALVLQARALERLARGVVPEPAPRRQPLRTVDGFLGLAAGAGQARGLARRLRTRSSQDGVRLAAARGVHAVEVAQDLRRVVVDPQLAPGFEWGSFPLPRPPWTFRSAG
jgi:crotonobetainyl-CoA:carnitine CoA-transferase CaiB-like acyl-CoA transferase